MRAVRSTPPGVTVVDVDEPEGAGELVDEITRCGVRTRLDDTVDQGFGRRATDWELQGVPIRVEIGPRDIADNAAVLCRRDTRDRTKVALADAVDEVQRLTRRMQTGMLDAATARRDAFISDCITLDQARDVAQAGVARVPWTSIGVAGEESLAADGFTVRYLQLGDGALPGSDDDASAVAYIARAY